VAVAIFQSRSELDTQNTFYRSSRAGCIDGKQAEAFRIGFLEAFCFVCGVDVIHVVRVLPLPLRSPIRPQVNAGRHESFCVAENFAQRKGTTLWRVRPSVVVQKFASFSPRVLQANF
jgi:hypothetical protein